MESGLKFRKTSLQGTALIKGPGVFRVRVLNNVSESNLLTDENGSRYIVNLKAVAKDKQAQLIETFSGVEEVPIEQTNGLFLTASIWTKEGKQQRLPMKNEEVEVAINYVKSREGEQVLRATNIRVLSAASAEVLDMDSLFAPKEVTTSELETAK